VWKGLWVKKQMAKREQTSRYGRAMFLFRVKNPKKYATALEAGAGQGRLMQVVVQSIQIA
jgi:hypothetical protein